MNRISNIVVIEDHVADFITLKQHISPVNASLTHFTSIETLATAASDIAPDVIFVDLKPHTNAMQMMSTINSWFPLAAIIILSGTDDENMVIQAIQAGAQDYILKDDLNKKLIHKTIQYSYERKRSQVQIQESNTRYHSVFKASNDPLWDWSLITNEITWNDRVNIFGYPFTVVKDRSWVMNNIHPEDYGRVTEKLATFISDGADLWNDEYRFKCYDGAYKVIRDRGHIIRNAAGDPIRVIGSMHDITEIIALHAKLSEEQETKRKEVMKAMILGQEVEKKQIGKELHDNINQLLAIIKMFLEIAINEEMRNREMVIECSNLVKEAMTEVRKLSHSLLGPSLGNLSLHEALSDIEDRFNSSNKLKLVVEDFTDQQVFDPGVQLTIFRIVQEQLQNVLKHSKATTVDIGLHTKEESIVLTVADNGIGFDKNHHAGGVGLNNILSRVSIYDGNVNIITAPGEGCVLEVILPVTRTVNNKSSVIDYLN